MRFVEATLKSIQSIEKFNGSNSPLNKISAETKILTMIIVIILMLVMHSLFTLFLLLSFLIMESLILERSVFKTWLFIPLFTGIIAIPAIFITPGTQIWSFYFLGITQEGIKAALYLTVRTLIAVTAVALVTKTTRWDDIMYSLKSLKLPNTFIMILFLTFRYIFFFTRILEDTLLSIKSRVIGKEKSIESWKLYAPLVGNLFIKTYKMEEKIFLSMKARGFSGEYSYTRERNFEINWPYLLIFIFLAIILISINGGLLWRLPNLKM